MFHLSSTSRCVTMAAALAFGSAAHANLVTNGGFETGDFSGWTQFDNTGFSAVDTGAVRSGTFGAGFGPVESTGGIFQTLSTVAGQAYDISFWLVGFGGAENSVAFNWDGGADELALFNAADFAYTEYTYSLLATSSSTDLRFSFRHDPAYYGLDDVAVTVAAAVVPEPAAVPEPTSLLLVGLALAGAAVATRKKRSA